MAKSLATVAAEHPEHVEAERYQLDQQVGALLAATDDLVTQLGYVYGDPVHCLLKTADQVRKEREK